MLIRTLSCWICSTLMIVASASPVTTNEKSNAGNFLHLELIRPKLAKRQIQPSAFLTAFPYMGFMVNALPSSAYDRFDKSKRSGIPKPSQMSLPFGLMQPVFANPVTAGLLDSLNEQAVHPQEDANEQASSIMSKRDEIAKAIANIDSSAGQLRNSVDDVREAFITQTADNNAELDEKVDDDGKDDVKRSDIARRKQEKLMKAYKKTLESKNALENKLVNYFADYVCGTNCRK